MLILEVKKSYESSIRSFDGYLSGYVGKKVKNGKVGTIIGLDPAGNFENSKLWRKSTI